MLRIFLAIITLCSFFTSTAQELYLLEKPVDSRLLILRADSLANEEKLEEALELIDKINPGDTNYTDALLERFDYLSQLERYEEAIEACKTGIDFKSDDNDEDFWLNIGYVYGLQEKHKEAIDTYKSILKRYPYHRSAHNNLAYEYLNLEEYDSSYTTYKEHVELYPFDDNAHFNLAVFALNEGHFTEAFMAFNMVILLNPYSERAYNVLSLLNELSNNTKLDLTAKEGFDLESKEYKDIDLLIENYVALKSQYKFKGKDTNNFGTETNLTNTQFYC